MAYHLGVTFCFQWHWRGYLAVDFFFALSGFIMVLVYEHKMAAAGGQVAFALVRWWRLWPIMAIGWLIGLPLYLTAPESSWWAPLLGLVFVPMFSGRFVYPVDPPAWSIFFELLANALHVLALRRLRTSSVAAIAAALLPVVVAITLLHHAMTGGPNPRLFGAAVPRVVFSYCLGVVLARLWQAGKLNSRAIPFPLALLALPAYLALGNFVSMSGALFDLAFVTLVSPIMLLGGLNASRLHSKLAWLGAISFPLYSVHQPIFDIAARLHAPAGLAVLAALAAATAISRVERAVTRSRSRGLAVGHDGRVSRSAASAADNDAAVA